MDIQALYLVWADRLRKNQSGYISNDEFNRLVDAAQNDLYFVYFSQYELNQSVPDGLRPFVKEAEIPVVDGVVAFPADYRHRIELYAVIVKNVDGGNPTKTEYLTTYLEGNEWGQTLASPIRKPSLEGKTFMHTMGVGGFKIAPTALTLTKIRYLREFSPSNRQITVVDDNEEYDPATSSPLDWPESTKEQLLELMLMYSGLPLRDPVLIQFMGNVNQNLQTTKV